MAIGSFRLAVVAATALVAATFYVFIGTTSSSKRRKRGPRGYKGNRGEKGNDSEDLNDIDICHQQLIIEATNVYNDYVEKYNLEKPELMDQINNVYLKDNFKRIR